MLKAPLSQLAEIAHLHPKLFCMAWESLSVESKLSLVEEVLQKGDGSPPEWLVDLVLRPNEAEFIRFWAIKSATLTKSQAERVAASNEPLLKIVLPFAGGTFMRPPPPPLAGVGEEGISLFWRYRTFKTAALGQLVEWLHKHELNEAYSGKALHAGVWGLLSRDDVQKLFREQTESWLEMDGMERAGYANDMSMAWALVQSTRHRDVAMSLAYWLPTYTLGLEEILGLPGHLQRVLLKRKWVTKEVRQLIDHIGPPP